MVLTRFGYYTDFVVYPVATAALAMAGLASTASPAGAARWLALFAACLASWTLLEYLLHRFVFHEAPQIREMHFEHHAREKELLGTPTWISLSAHLVFGFLPIYLIFGFTVASAVSAGLMAGYLWYITVHHMVHHWHPAHSTYLYGLKRRHALHHHHDPDTYFGVTSSFWDRVFRTARLKHR